ncbi:MAG: hypothetical protein GY711_35285 [bacterium]|nr:hypothetical protein [bacterium]
MLTSLLTLAVTLIPATQDAPLFKRGSDASPAPASGVSVFLGASAEVGSIVVCDEATGAVVWAPTEWSNLRLRAIDFVGRTELHMLVPDQPLRIEDGSGSRLALPADGGSLYAFERPGSHGATFGYLHVGTSGVPRIALERAGTGAQGTEDPFLARVAVSPQGDAFLVATTVAAGGDLLEVDCTSPAVYARTWNVPPQPFSDAGLVLNATWGVGVAEEGFYRFARRAGARATPVPFRPGEAPVYYSGQLVVSLDRDTAMATAGNGITEQYPYLFGETGAARRVGQIGMHISPAGFLPEHRAGPFLAVADGGELVAWRREGHTREAFLARADVQQEPVQISADDYFSYYLEEIGLIGFFNPDVLTMGIAEELDLEGRLRLVDVFDVRMSADEPTFINLTLSNGDATVPFDGFPTIVPERVVAMPGTGHLLLHDAIAHELHAIVPGQGAFELVDEAEDLDFILSVSGDVLTSIVLESGSDDEFRELIRFTQDLTQPFEVLYSGSDDLDLLAPTGTAAGSVAWVLEDDDPQWVARTQLGSGLVETLPVPPSMYAPPLAFTAGGGVAFGQLDDEDDALVQFGVWGPSGGIQPLLLAPGRGHLLPGR